MFTLFIMQHSCIKIKHREIVFLVVIGWIHLQIFSDWRMES